MMKVISVWVKDPVAGWKEFSKAQYEEVAKDYTCIYELVGDICILNAFEFPKVRLPATEIIGKCMKHSLFVKTRLQEENPQMNQAEYEIRIVTEVCE